MRQLISVNKMKCILCVILFCDDFMKKDNKVAVMNIASPAMLVVAALLTN